ncbi:MAG: hypothetical protein EU548_07980 [Promethearchaeota archaeon]|nr:MAG: hypothetical protein EU548_07980 [Candidatus Lokiarchaeota archaeon]
MDYEDPLASMHFEYLIIGGILIGVGMFILIYPNQRALGKWGVNKSIQTLGAVAKEMNEEMESKLSDLQIRLCVKCGRNIPFDARLCPYCGHKYD